MCLGSLACVPRLWKHRIFYQAVWRAAMRLLRALVARSRYRSIDGPGLHAILRVVMPIRHVLPRLDGLYMLFFVHAVTTKMTHHLQKICQENLF